MQFMQAQLQKIGKGIGFLLSPEEAEELNLSEGDTVAFEKAAGRPIIQYATTDEAISAYKRTEPRFADAYTELAK